MLNIFKLKLKKSFKIIKTGINNKNFFRKKTDPNVRNWKNSIYTYNKSILSLIPEASKITLKLINGYFNLYSFKLIRILNKDLYKKIFKRIKFRRFYSNKIYISDGQFKHTNDLVNITVYFYNRQLFNYKRIILIRYFRLFNKYKLIKKFKYLKIIGLNYLKRQQRKNKIIKKYLNFNNFYESNYVKNINNIYYRRLIKKSLYNIILYMYFRQLIFINEYKFNNYYLQGLTNLIKKIYKKNVIFNFVNVKYFFFKIRGNKNRKRVLKFLNLIVLKSKISKFKLHPLVKYSLNVKALNNTNNLDITNVLLYDILFQNKSKSNYLKKIVLNNINYKKVSGIKLHLGGRLTRHNTASRSMSKNRIKGNLINFYSSKYGKYSSLLRGTLKSNLDYTNLNSKVRIGGFGVKGWISGI